MNKLDLQIALKQLKVQFTTHIVYLSIRQETTSKKGQSSLLNNKQAIIDMTHYKVEIKYVDLPGELSSEIVTDILSQMLADIGFESFEYQEEGCCGYIQQELLDKESIDNVVSSFPIENVKMDYSLELIPNEDWNKEWESKYFQPVVVNDQCIIKAPFHEVDKSYKYTILIDPKMAFGTGSHDTTALIMRYLISHKPEGKIVLDMGCGTGVLAIAANLFEAKETDAIDIDQSAVDNTIKNLELNLISHCNVIKGDASAIPSNKQYDLIMANIMRNILLEDMDKYEKVLKEEGKLIMSGFYQQDAEIITQKAQSLGLKMIYQESTPQGWTMVVVQKCC